VLGHDLQLALFGGEETQRSGVATQELYGRADDIGGNVLPRVQAGELAGQAAEQRVFVERARTCHYVHDDVPRADR